jgi:ABC-type Zn2+ transport system substrate-binding protein/surface adhesin
MKTQNKTKKQTQIENTRERERERHTHTHTHTHGERDRRKRILNAHNREFASKIAKKLASREKPNPRMQREKERNDLPTRRRWYSVSVLSVVAVVVVVFVALGRCRRRR